MNNLKNLKYSDYFSWNCFIKTSLNNSNAGIFIIIFIKLRDKGVKIRIIIIKLLTNFSADIYPFYSNINTKFYYLEKGLHLIKIH